MNECLNPPCNSLIATTCFEFTIAGSSDEGRATTPFTDVVLTSAEGEWAIDEDASTMSMAPNNRVVPNSIVAAIEGEGFTATFWIIWVARRVLWDIKIREVRLLLMTVPSILWVVSMRTAVPSQRAGHLQMWFCLWKLWNKVFDLRFTSTFQLPTS